MTLPSDVVAIAMPVLEMSPSSYSAGIICGSLSHGVRSSSQPAFSNCRFWTCMAKLKTSNDGLPEFSSIATFWRACCSGMTSMPSVMPVWSRNSFWYFFMRSARGPVSISTSTVWPLKRFQSKAPWA